MHYPALNHFIVVSLMFIIFLFLCLYLDCYIFCPIFVLFFHLEQSYCYKWFPLGLIKYCIWIMSCSFQVALQSSLQRPVPQTPVVPDHLHDHQDDHGVSLLSAHLTAITRAYRSTYKLKVKVDAIETRTDLNGTSKEVLKSWI